MKGFMNNLLNKRNIFIIVLLLFWVYPCSPLPAQEGWGKGVIFGRVIDVNGDPVNHAKIRAEYFGSSSDLEIVKKKKPVMMMETESDEEGKWRIMGVNSGVWRISASIEGQGAATVVRFLQMGRQHDLGLSFVLPKVDLMVRKKAMEDFLAARKAIYYKKWQEALDILDKVQEDNTAPDMLDEILYWKSYSLYKVSRSVKAADLQVEKLKRALEYLDRLSTAFATGEWVDDGQLLKLEIWHRMYELGEKKYLGRVRELAGKEKEDISLKLAALDVLARLEPETALPLLKPVLFDHPDPEMRKKALLVLSRCPTLETIKILQQVYDDDKDPGVRARAGMMLKK